MQLEAGKRTRIAVTIALALLAWSGVPALAGDWDIQPTLTAEELFTDNSNLSQDDRESDLITIIRPGITIERTGAARSNLSLDVSFDHTRYLRETQSNDTYAYLQAEAGAEVFEDVFFVDGSASIDQVIVSDTSSESGTGITDQSNRTQVSAVSINPNLRHHFRNWADFRFDYVLSNVRVEDDSIDNTVTQRFGSTLTGGRNFPNLRWDIQTLSQETQYRGTSERDDTRRLARLNTRFSKWRVVQPIVSVGYERIKDSTIVEQPDGPIWSLGALLVPGPRTSIEFTHGQRYGDPNTSLNASYQISERTSLTATYSQVLASSQSLSLSELDSAADGLTEQRTGFSLTNDTFRQSEFDANLRAERGRNSYRIQYRWTERKTDADGSTETVNNINASWQRNIHSKLSGTLDLGARNTDFGPTQGNREDNFFTYSVGLTYRVQENLRSTLQYNGTRKISDASGSSYTENAVSFSLTALF